MSVRQTGELRTSAEIEGMPWTDERLAGMFASRDYYQESAHCCARLLDLFGQLA